MRVSYRFFKNFDKSEVIEFKKYGIKINEGCDAFEIYEDDPLFEEIKNKLGDNWMDYASADTDFSEKERSSSDYLYIEARKMLGYPQPEDCDERKKEPAFPFNIYPYLEGVFRVKNTSPEYGMLRGEQIGSFSLPREPKCESAIGSIFWCEDIFFVSKDVYRSIFEPIGVKCLPVLAYPKPSRPFENLVQLLPQGISKSRLDIKSSQLDFTVYVKEWQVQKYILNRKGFFPSFVSDPGPYDFFVSQEYFGDGAGDLKNVIISQRLYQILKTYKIKGVKYYPMQANSKE